VVFSLTNSNNLKERAKKVIPHITGTFSRGPNHFVEGVYPVYAKSGLGSHFTDVDGNEFIDYLMALGPITLGYNYKPVNDAIIKQLHEGILFSLPNSKEVELSELISQTIPNADMVKFEKSGSNAVTGAVRAARAITKRDKIAYCGSGGVWHDWQATMVSRDGGVPKFNKDLIKIFEYNDSDGLEQIFIENKDEIAAIILEPTIYEKPSSSFLQKVRTLADANNSLLIFDEIVTGFRFDLGGCQNLYNVKADMVCFGKGMGNGLPISAITGPNEFMKIFDSLWVSSTNNPEALSLAGTISVINEMKEKNTIQSCWRIGEKLFNGWNKIAKNHDLNINMIGYPIRMAIQCKDNNENDSTELEALVLQEMIKQGIFLAHGKSFLCYSHSEDDIVKTLNSFENICEFINKIKPDQSYKHFLEGNMPKTIWSMAIPPTKKSFSQNN